MTPATRDARSTTRASALVVAVTLAVLAVLLGVAVRDADSGYPAAPRPAARSSRQTTSTVGLNPLEQPAEVARDIVRDGAGAICAALPC